MKGHAISDRSVSDIGGMANDWQGTNAIPVGRVDLADSGRFEPMGEGTGGIGEHWPNVTPVKAGAVSEDSAAAIGTLTSVRSAQMQSR